MGGEAPPPPKRGDWGAKPPSLGNFFRLGLYSLCSLLNASESRQHVKHVSGENYPSISKHHISLIIHFCQKRHRRKKSCNKKICLKNHFVIHLELLGTYAILPLWQASPRPLAARLEPEESLPGTLETIPGCEIGEEESP